MKKLLLLLPLTVSAATVEELSTARWACFNGSGDVVAERTWESSIRSDCEATADAGGQTLYYGRYLHKVTPAVAPPPAEPVNDFSECSTHEAGFLCDSKRLVSEDYAEYAVTFNGSAAGWYYHPVGSCPQVIPPGYSINPTCELAPPDPEPDPEPPSGGDHATFDFLAVQPEAVKIESLRTQASIDRNARTRTPGANFPRYSSADDAAVQTNSGGNIKSADQFDFKFGPYNSGKTGVYWEFRQDDAPSVDTQKFWTIRQSDTDRSIEWRHRYSKATGSFDVFTDGRMYPTEGAAPAVGPLQPIVQIQEFQFRFGVWQQRYAEVDYSNSRVRLWAKNQTDSSWIQTHDVPMASLGSHDRLRNGGNSSQSGSGSWKMAYRNVVVLRGFNAGSLVN